MEKNNSAHNFVPEAQIGAYYTCCAVFYCCIIAFLWNISASFATVQCSVHWLLEEYKSTYRRLKDQLGLFLIFKTSQTGTTYTVMVDYIRFFFIDLGTSITSILYSCPVFGGNLSNMRVMIATHSAHVLSDT